VFDVTKSYIFDQEFDKGTLIKFVPNGGSLGFLLDSYDNLKIKPVIHGSTYLAPERTKGMISDEIDGLYIETTARTNVKATLFYIPDYFSCEDFYLNNGNNNLFVVGSDGSGNLKSNVTNKNYQHICLFNYLKGSKAVSVRTDLKGTDEALYIRFADREVNVNGSTSTVFETDELLSFNFNTRFSTADSFIKINITNKAKGLENTSGQTIKGDLTSVGFYSYHIFIDPEPAKPTPKPATPTPEPVTPTQEPVLPSDEPTLPSEESTLPIDEPVLPTPKPVDPTKEPSKPTPKPSTPTPKPVVPTPETEEPEQKPEEPAKGPEPTKKVDPSNETETFDSINGSNNNAESNSIIIKIDKFFIPFIIFVILLIAIIILIVYCCCCRKKRYDQSLEKHILDDVNDDAVPEVSGPVFKKPTPFDLPQTTYAPQIGAPLIAPAPAPSPYGNQQFAPIQGYVIYNPYVAYPDKPNPENK
jgi:hypothetical protein